LDQSTIEILVLAFIAGFVLFRLYTTLGKRTGEERPNRRRRRASFRAVRCRRRPRRRCPCGSAGEGVAAIERADPNFEAGYFLQGARSAYEMIVGAFAKGDRDALRGLLTPRVYESYVAAIEAREAQNGIGPEIVRLEER
jgi:hypothetical protein